MKKDINLNFISLNLLIMLSLVFATTNVSVAETIYGVIGSSGDGGVTTQQTGGYGGIHLSWRYTPNYTVGDATYFSCDGTHDIEEPPRSFTCYWDFGDGTSVSNGDNVTHVFNNTGTYVVSVSACLDGKEFNNTNCAYDVAQLTIYLESPPDSTEVNIRGPYYGIAGQAIGFKTPYVMFAKYEWNFGDGANSDNRTPSHVYANPGIYQVTLKLKNILGQTLGFASTTAEVSEPPPNQAPVAIPGGPYTAVAGVSTTLNGAGSYDPEGSALTYKWRFSDMGGKTVSGKSVIHTFEEAGTYIVTLWVNDGQLESVPVTTEVTVSANPNQASLIPYCNSITQYYGSQLHTNFINPENGAWLGSRYLGLNSGITAAFTKRVTACSTGSIYNKPEFDGLCSYQCYSSGDGVYCNKYDTDGGLKQSGIYMGRTSFVTSGLNHQVIVGCSSSIPAAPSDPNMCYLSCYNSGSQMMCSKKKFSGETVSTAYYGGNWAITTNAGHNQIVSCN